MALTQFIKDLLYTNEKLTIPGFGSFVAQHTSAQVNNDKKLLFPPQKHFVFNTALNQEDDVFASYISKKTDVTLSEAKQSVKVMVEDFHKKLKEGNTLYIEEVGYFILNDSKEIKFKADDENNFHPESFGLEPINYRPPIQQLVEESITEDYYPERKRTPLRKILVIFLIINLVGALSAIVYWKFSDIREYVGGFTSSKQNAENIAVADTQVLNVNSDTTELGQIIDSSTLIQNALNIETPAKTDTVVPAEPPVEKKEVTSSKVKYYIIAGSFQTFDKANVHAKILKNKGFKPEIIEFSQNLFRISIQEFSNKEEAVQQLEVIKAKKGTETAWLLAK